MKKIKKKSTRGKKRAAPRRKASPKAGPKSGTGSAARREADRGHGKNSTVKRRPAGPGPTRRKKAASAAPASRKASPKKGPPRRKSSSGSSAASARRAGAARGFRRRAGFELETPEATRGLGPETGGQSGDTEGLSRSELADSESVEELLEEGQAFEAGIVSGVENAPDADVSEVRTRQFPEDDVPREYLDED